MATEIQELALGDSTPSDTVDYPEKNGEVKNAFGTTVCDVEDTGGQVFDDGTHVPLIKAERIELIPNEAFDWDVSGDQSPCTSLTFLFYSFITFQAVS
ncbi:hypothetical protein SPI_06132 [Niveomyces insectorum RCEF 264]|uniref:Uncharacterized protein n=1 Tax=Niveomyces insectorum RCEF 264 TaxID=1081102 RepID=A0A167RTQ4_9HYPO|nr:hypothetical protein SPI_06132 [Niveomyces insectorum RCEF 264]